MTNLSDVGGGRCPHSGLLMLSCKVSDLCDCFDFPEADAQATEIIAARDARGGVA